MSRTELEVRHFHLFCGLGGGARGFNAGEARIGPTSARFRCIGGVDSSPAAVCDFSRMAGVPGAVLDLFSREQYAAFHGAEPPAGWREATAEDLQRAAGWERPSVVFQSSPCKGFSGLLSEARSGSEKYQALNGLAIRGVRLTLEAWGDDPPEFILFENVPRIATRGRALLEEIERLLKRAGYSVAETTHDCGELGGLGQHRRRFLLVARHREKVPPFLYEPPRRRVRSVGEVLGPLPLPDDARGGPMHRLPRVSWDTWLRLALIPAGGDWRALKSMDFGRLRLEWTDASHRNKMAVGAWDEPGGTVIGATRPGSGAPSIADWGEASPAVTGGAGPSSGGLSVADPRRAGNYGVVPWEEAAGAIVGAARADSGAFNVADPRLPAPGDHPDPPPLIISLDDTWYRPFTTLELAALQGFPVLAQDRALVLDGTSHSAWRERIGNAVPPPTAAAIASVMGHALLLAAAGETFELSATPAWVQPFAFLIAIDGGVQ